MAHAGKGQSQLRVQAYLFLRQSFCLSYHTGHLDVTGREGPISLILILQVFRIVLVAFAAFSLKYNKQHVTENTEKLIPLGPSLCKQVHTLKNKARNIPNISF